MYRWRYLLFLTVMLLWGAGHWLAGAQGTNRAAVVISFGDGQTESACVEFSEAEITGYEALSRSGLAVEAEAQGIGAAICSIGGVGCPANDCWCHCSGGDCVYWSYWHQVEGAWQYSQAGASIYPVTDGAVEGWAWGPGSITEAIPPPNLSFEDVCALPATDTPFPPPTHLNPQPRQYRQPTHLNQVIHRLPLTQRLLPIPLNQRPPRPPALIFGQNNNNLSWGIAPPFIGMWSISEPSF